MKLAVPLINHKDVEPLIWCGADEFYCGIIIQGNIHPFFSNLNRRTLKANNFCDINSLKQAVLISHSYNTPVYLTLNEMFTKFQYPYINEIIKIANQCNIDGLIISDFGLLLFLYNNKLYKRFKIVIGTGGISFNTNTILFYKKHGAQRVIFSRKLFPEEIINVKDNLMDNSIETEAFMEGGGYCPNLDGLCNYLHNKGNIGKYGSCAPSFQLGYISPGNIELNNHIKKTIYNNCKLCFIYDLIKIKINVLKILGREDTVNIIKKRVKLTKKLISIAKNCNSKKEFVNYVTDEFLSYQSNMGNNKIINCNKEVCCFKNEFVKG